MKEQYDDFQGKIACLKRMRIEVDKFICQHPLWYFWDEQVGSYGNRWICQCVQCGDFRIDNKKNFAGKIIIKSDYPNYSEKIDTNFKTVETDYDQLKKQDYNEQEIKKLLLTKYNGR